MLSFKRGDTWRFVVPWPHEDNLAGCEARMQLRRSPCSPPAVSLSTEDGSLVVDVDLRIFSAQLDPEVTRGVLPLTYESDLEVTFADGTVTSTPTFDVDVLPDVTRDEEC